MFSIPSVQTKLGKYATKRLNEDFNTNINIGKVGLQFNGDVELKDIYIEDHKQNELISIDELNTSIISFNNLLNNKFAFADVDIEGLVFNIKTYKGEINTNLDVFVAKFDEENPRKDKSDFVLSSGDVSIYDSTFSLIDENKENQQILEFSNLNINATDFLINGSDVSARINILIFKDSRGLEMKNMSTNFVYTLHDMTFDNLNINTLNSNLKGKVKFSYIREDLQHFTDKVNVNAHFREADVALDELNFFYNEFGAKQRAQFSVDLLGTLNKLTANNLELNTSKRSIINGDIYFENLFNAKENNFSMDAKFTNLTSNHNDLKALLPNVLGDALPTVFEKFGDFKIVGKTQLTTTTINADIDINSQLGFIDSNLTMHNINDIDNANYEGNIIFEDFNLGILVDDPNLDITSLNLDVDGVGFTKENIDVQVNGEVYSINYNNYSYENLTVFGNLKEKIFNGKLNADDKNFKLEFNGLVDFSEDIYKFDFVANVEYANLKALNFVKNDELADFRGIVDMKMNGTNVNDAEGNILFNNTYYKNENNEYFFDDFAITSTFHDDERKITVNSPDILQGQMNGDFLFEDIKKLFENSIGSIYTNYKPHDVKENQHINFNFKIYNKIIAVFYPDLKLGKNTFIKGRVESNEKAFNLNFRSPKIQLSDNFANNINLQVDNKNPLFNTYIEVDSINTKHYNVSKLSLINVTLNDTLFMRSEFRGGKSNKDIYNLSFYHTINEDNKSVVGFKPSEVTFRENKWLINENRNNYNKLTFDKELTEFNLDRFVMSHNNEEIQLSGVIKDSTQKDIKLNFKDVNLAKITPRIDSLALAGNVNGKLDILQQNGVYLPNSTITIDNFEINKFVLGSFDATITGNESLTNYRVNASIKNDKTNSFKAVGNIDVSNETSSIDVTVDFNKFNLNPLNPFGEDVITNIRGLVSGKAQIVGNLTRPKIIGNLSLDDGGLSIPYLNVDYDFGNQSSITLVDQSFIFNNVPMIDTEFETLGRLNGKLSHINFSDWSLDLNIDTDRLLILNTTETEESLYFGTGYIGGTANISGPTDQLTIAVEGETKEGTIFKIPLNDSESFGDNSFIHILSPEEKRSKLLGEVVEFNEIKGLEMDFDLSVNQNAEIELVLDKDSGSTIKGRGVGELLFDINTNGKFNIYGDIWVYEGIYNFYGGVLQKKFIVEQGGSLSWDGDPMEARVNLKAVYETTANPSPLLDNPINRSIPVNVEINLTGNLEKPEPDFTFSFPNVNSTISSELNYRLESKDDRDNQALYLLSTGSFSRGLTDLNFSGTFSERLNGIVNGIFTDDNGKFNMNINYEVGENRPDYQTDDRLGVTLQTKISDRVMINGKVGVPIGGATETVIAGDVQIDFLLNKDGTLTAKVFNRENSIRNFGEEIGYTQGAGIAYNVEFDSFKELIQKIFKRKSKKEERLEKEKPVDSIDTKKPLPDFINITSRSSN